MKKKKRALRSRLASYSYEHRALSGQGRLDIILREAFVRAGRFDLAAAARDARG